MIGLRWRWSFQNWENSWILRFIGQGHEKNPNRRWDPGFRQGVVADYSLFWTIRGCSRLPLVCLVFREGGTQARTPPKLVSHFGAFNHIIRVVGMSLTHIPIEGGAHGALAYTEACTWTIDNTLNPTNTKSTLRRHPGTMAGPDQGRHAFICTLAVCVRCEGGKIELLYLNYNYYVLRQQMVFQYHIFIAAHYKIFSRKSHLALGIRFYIGGRSWYFLMSSLFTSTLI